MYTLKNVGTRLFFFFGLLLFLIPLASANAATYYVSKTSGSDSNSGTSTSTPWQTVAKVNATSFGPGDTILFARGEEWRESLIVSSSGSTSSPITFDAYGDGAKPKFLGSNVLTNANFVSEGGDLYTYNLGQTANTLLVDHVFLIDVDHATPGQSTPGTINANGEWHMISSTTLRLKSATNPITNGKVYTATVRDDVVNSNSKDHLVFNNLVTDESAKVDTGYGFRIQGSTDVIINDSEAYRAGKHHFGVISSTGFVGNNLYSAYTIPGQGTDASAYVSYGDGATSVPAGQTSVWNNIVFEHPENIAASLTNYYIFITHGTHLGSVEVNNATSYGANFSAGNGDNASTTIRINGGLIENAKLELSGTGIVVDGMKMTGANSNVDIFGSNTILQNMLITGANPGTAGYQSAIVSRGDNNIVRFSTIVMDPESYNYNPAIAVTNDDANFKYYGNIFLTQGRIFRLWSGNSLTSNTLSEADYNFYQSSPIFLGEALSLSSWQGLGYDTNSKTGDPSFVNTSSQDYSLASTSEAVNAAVLSSSLETEVPLDIAGNDRLVGSNFDMGAYENQNPSSPSNNTPLSYIPGNIDASDVLDGGEGVGYNNASVSEAELGLGSSGSWGRYAVDVLTTGKYYLTAQTLTGIGNGTIRFKVDGVDVTGQLAVPNTNWSYYATTSAENIELTSGEHIIEAYTDTGALGLQSFKFTPSLPGVIDAVNVNPGGEGVGYNNATTTSGNLDLPSNGSWGRYNVHVLTPGKYYLTVRASTGANNETLRVKVNGVDLTGAVPVPNTGWGVYGDINLENIELTAGDHVMEVYTDTGAIGVNRLTFVTSLPGIINAGNVDLGGSGVGYYGANVTPTELGLSQGGNWGRYTVHVLTSGKYLLTANISTGADNETIKFKVDGVDVTGNIAVPNTGWGVYGDITAENIELSAGSHVIEAYTETGALGLRTIKFTTSLPGTINAGNVDLGGDGVGYNNAGVTPTELGLPSSGSWGRYTVHVLKSGKYLLTTNISTGADNETIKFKVDGVDVTGNIAVPNTGWGVYGDMTLENIELSAGSHVIEAYTETGALGLRTIKFTTSLPGIINAGNVDLGGSGVGYYGANVTPTELGLSQSGNWGNYTVHVVTTNPYRLIANVSTGADNETIKFKVDGVDVTGNIAVPNTGWGVYGDITADISLTAGSHVIQAYTETGAIGLKTITLKTSLPGTINAGNVDLGGDGVGYNNAGVTPTELGLPSSGSWGNYTVYVSSSTNYTLTANISTGADNETIKFKVDGVDVTGNIAVPNTGWGVYGDIVANNISLTAGTHTIQAYTETGALGLRSVTFTIP